MYPDYTLDTFTPISQTAHEVAGRLIPSVIKVNRHVHYTPQAPNEEAYMEKMLKYTRSWSPTPAPAGFPSQ